MSNLKELNVEYIYMTIPAEYVCVYHKILAMLADYGEEMLKDCKASCTDRNSNVIECFNMFNAAVAARKLNKTKLAETIIKYVKAKINQIYSNTENNPGFVFPVDEHGKLKAFVSCDGNSKFEVSSDTGLLYQIYNSNGTIDNFSLSDYDESPESVDIVIDNSSPVEENEDDLYVDINPDYLINDNNIIPNADIIVKYAGDEVDLDGCLIDYYFDNTAVLNFNQVTGISVGSVHNFKVIVTYKGHTKIISKNLTYKGYETE